MGFNLFLVHESNEVSLGEEARRLRLTRNNLNAGRLELSKQGAELKNCMELASLQSV